MNSASRSRSVSHRQTNRSALYIVLIASAYVCKVAQIKQQQTSRRLVMWLVQPTAKSLLARCDVERAADYDAIKAEQMNIYLNHRNTIQIHKQILCSWYSNTFPLDVIGLIVIVIIQW